MLLVGSRLVEISYVNTKLWKNKMERLLWISLWKIYSLLVSDPYKEKSLDMCDELPCDVISHKIFDFRRMGDPISKECKVSCWKSCE